MTLPALSSSSTWVVTAFCNVPIYPARTPEPDRIRRNPGAEAMRDMLREANLAVQKRARRARRRSRPMNGGPSSTVIGRPSRRGSPSIRVAQTETKANPRRAHQQRPGP